LINLKETTIEKIQINVKEYGILGVILVMVILAWTSIIDTTAYNMNIESLKATSGAFVVIKAFNALVSLAENIPFLGAIMSPYTDFLDRMSWVMLISLMSLGLQKVIIVSVQSFIVNAILTSVFIIVAVNKLHNFLSLAKAQVTFKILIVMLLIRFSIPFMTFMITSIEHSIYQVQEEVSQERITALEEKLTAINDLLADDKKLQDEKHLKEELINKKINILANKKITLTQEIKDIKHKEGEFLGVSTYMISSVDKKTQEKVKQREVSIDKINLEMDNLEERKDNLDSFFNFTDMKVKIKTAIENLNYLMSEMFDIFLTWVILFFFKNVFFPIFFLIVLFKTFDSLFKTQLSNKLHYTE